MAELLPEFERPPVVEVALAVQFDQLDVATLQLGLIWERFREQFARIEEKPVLEPAFERFGPAERSAASVRVQFSSVPAVRFWFVNQGADELVQVQRDRFVRNWRKTDVGNEYPRYQNLIAAFIRDWNTLQQYVHDELALSVTPNQCEVTYVNVIELSQTGRLCDLLTLASEPSSFDFLSPPESAELRYHFTLSTSGGAPWGRLHVEVLPVIRATDDQPVVRLNLTARGSLPGLESGQVLTSLDACHEAVVRGFAEITTPAMHTAWGRKS